MDDMALLREYASRDSEAAFEALVLRRVNFVYSAALRQVRDPHLAEEITQAVFVILAQKAGRISDKTILTGWLFRTTRFAALAQMRADAKRRQREQEAHMESEIQSPVPDQLWEQMSPLLDEALAQLGEKDRQAVLLRFFEDRSLAEVGNSLGTGEDTARKRVSRALEKLRGYFSRRGVVSTTAIIAGAISANSVQAAPVALAKSVTAIAVAKDAAVGGSTLTLIEGALKIMAWTKAKTAIVSGAVVLVTAGTTLVAVKSIREHWIYPWRDMVDGGERALRALDTTPPQVTIVRSKYSTDQRHRRLFDDIGSPDRWRLIAVHVPAEEIVRAAYYDPAAHINNDLPFLVVAPADMPKGFYDFIANLPAGSREALQALVKKKFGLVGRYEMREMDVLLLEVANPNARGLKPGTPQTNALSRVTNGLVHYKNRRMSQLAAIVQRHAEVPIVDQTGLTGNYDFDFPDEPGATPADRLETASQWLFDKFGLKLVPNRQPHEVFVIDRIK